MKRMLAFSRRNAKEILRDGVTLFFGIAFPLTLLLLMTAIQANIPVEIYNIERLAPGVAAFGLCFLSLFSAMLISKDRTTSFLMRLYSSPMTPSDFILGYTLPLVPMGIVQSAVCFFAATIFRLPASVNILLAIVVLIPSALLYIAIGLLCGSLMNDKQVGGICGALLTNVSGWLSGVWFDLALVGGAFEKIACALPFVHAADAARAAIAGDYAAIPTHIAVVLAYAVVIYILAVVIFRKKMKM